jgi:Spy/CpxP family protein refolding chaperone
MTVRRSIAVVTLLLMALAAAPGGAAPRLKWWQSKAAVTTLGLTASQVERIETIFEQTRPDRLRLQGTLDDLEAAFRRAMDDNDYARAEDLVAQVESARMAHNIARTMMLIRISRVLTHAQRAKLRDIRDQLAVPAAAAAPYDPGR